MLREGGEEIGVVVGALFALIPRVHLFMPAARVAWASHRLMLFYLLLVQLDMLRSQLTEGCYLW
jgi:hypothetical protein